MQSTAVSRKTSKARPLAATGLRPESRSGSISAFSSGRPLPQGAAPRAAPCLASSWHEPPTARPAAPRRWLPQPRPRLPGLRPLRCPLPRPLPKHRRARAPWGLPPGPRSSTSHAVLSAGLAGRVLRGSRASGWRGPSESTPLSESSRAAWRFKRAGAGRRPALRIPASSPHVFTWLPTDLAANAGPPPSSPSLSLPATSGGAPTAATNLAAIGGQSGF